VKNGISDDGLRRIAQSKGLNVVEDPDQVFEILRELEGDEWAQRSLNDMSEYSWGGILRNIAESRDLVEGSGSGPAEINDYLKNASWVLYGDAGYSRYRIDATGSIYLWGSSVDGRPEFIEKAENLGLEVR